MLFETPFGMTFNDTNRIIIRDSTRDAIRDVIRNDRRHFPFNDEISNYTQGSNININKDKMKYGVMNKQFPYLKNYKQFSFN